MSSSNAPTRWGIASCGLISFDFANSLTTSLVNPNDHKVVAVAARAKDKAEEFARAFGVDEARAYGSYEELAKDKDVEVVYVGSINPTHLEICRMMLNAGKHILCEKPLGMNVKETREMLNLAKSKGLFFMEAMWARLQPAQLQLKAELDKGTIGEVFQSHVSFGQKIDSPRMRQMSLGGGSVLDLGVYAVYFSQLAHGGRRPTKIVAAGHLNSEGTDDTANAILTYPGGGSATITSTSMVVTPCEAEVHGTKGSMRLAYPFWCSQRLTVTPDGKTYENEVPQTGSRGHKFNFTNSAMLSFEAEHVRQCLLQGLKESPRLTHAETLLVAEIMEDIRKQIGVVYPQD